MHNFLKESSRSHRKSGNIHKGFPVPGSVSGDPGRKCQGHPSHVLRRYQQELRGQQESGLWQIQEAEPWYVCKYVAEIRTILLMRIILCCVKSCLDLCWMMCVVINNGNASDFALILETAVCTCKASKSFNDHLIRKVEKTSYGDGCKCIGYIVDTRYTEIVVADFFALEKDGERRMSIFIPGDICGYVISIVLKAIGKYLTWEVTGDRFIFRGVRVMISVPSAGRSSANLRKEWRISINVLEENQDDLHPCSGSR